MEYIKNENNIAESVIKDNSVIIPPCFIGQNVRLVNSVVGPHVSIGENTVIENTVIKNSIVQTNSSVKNVVIKNSMIGNKVELEGNELDLSIGDFTQQKL